MNDPLPRLLVLTSTYPRWRDDPEPGFVHELCKRLAEHFDVVVLAPHAAGAMTLEHMDGVQIFRYRYAPARWETLVNAGGVISNLKRRRWKWLLVPGFLLAQMWVAWQLIRRWRPDVIHAHWLIPQGLLVTLLTVMTRGAPPFVVTSHGADLFALRAAPLVALKRFVIKHAAAITVVSRAMQDEALRLGADPVRLSVQPMGVDMRHRFIPDSTVTRSTTEMLFVGRLVEKKGLDHLIAVMPAVLAACPKASLTVIGFGPQESSLRLQVRHLGLQDRVEFVGAVPQHKLPAFYRRAALFIAPFVRAVSGDQEGLGLVAVEAIGCGCPVLVGDVPAAHDIPVQRVDVTDHEAFAGAVIHILRNPEAALAAAEEKRRACLSRFDWSVVADGYADILEQKLAHRVNRGRKL